MPRQGNGAYQQPANTAAVSGATISSTAFNTLVTDIGSELTLSLDRNGRSAMAAALPMGGNKVTGAADPTTAQDVATKNYVDTTTATFFSTGDVKFTLKTAADSGWRMFDDGTIGNDTSGASLASTATAAALFTLLWNNISNTWCPIQDSTGAATTRGVSAAADFAASKRIPLPKVLGRALAVSGAGSGLTSRALGQTLGEETHTLAQAELPNVTLSASGSVQPRVAGSALIAPNTGATPTNFVTGAGATAYAAATYGVADSVTVNSTTSPLGSAVPLNQMQPTTFLNVMVKL